MALARCSRNKLMYWLYERISEVRQHAQWRRVKSMVLTTERIAFYNAQHRELYEAIAARDTALAVKLIKNHLYGVHDDLLDSNEE
jgi:DNA-binding GntR family transcriptional regulator